MYGLFAASSISWKWENHFFLFAFLFRFLMSTCYPVKAGQSCGGAAGLARKEAHNINTKTQSSELNSMNFKCQKLDIKKQLNQYYFNNDGGSGNVFYST